MDFDTTTVKPLLERALNLMATAAKWQEKAAKKCLIVGLQGEKRRMRYLGREALIVRDHLEYQAYDRLDGLDICAQSVDTDVAMMQCCESSMNHMISKLWAIRTQAHQIANDLVVANFKDFACFLYEYAAKIFSILGELQRNRKSYKKCDYDYHHVSRYQESCYNVHDAYECKEKEQGYSDD